LNPEQRACVERALAMDDLLLLWGPPGTGKTTVIAEICSQYARRGQRVLVASQANLAVEQALRRLPASPHVRPAWVSTARRREGDAGNVGGYLCAWLESVGRAVSAETPADGRWSRLLGEWAERCARVAPEDFSSDDEGFYLKHANVVGGTCNETGKPDFVASPRFNSRFDLVIVDEVSKATPPELLLPMLLGRRVMLVGDHRQLPPLFRDAHFEEAVETNELPREAVERFRDLVTTSWFEHAFRDGPAGARCALRRQYRMHPQIMAAVNLFYADQPLAAGDGEAALARVKMHGLRLRSVDGREWLAPRQHLAWVDTARDASGHATRDERVGTSRRNYVEAEACARIVAGLSTQAEARGLSVTVISFYKAQIGLLRDRLRKENLPREWFDPWRDVNTVDQFQGSERDIVIVSLVRTDARLTGEFARDFRRINVAISRARRVLIVLGSEPTFGEAEVEVPGAQADTVVATTAYRSIYELAARDGACVEAGGLADTEGRRR
jgi:superfamily I DNA and/or RNA helicase